MIHQLPIAETTHHGFPVNTGDHNQFTYYPVIMDKVSERLDWMTQKHCKVLFIRFDLRFPTVFSTDGGNSELSRFWKLLSERSAYLGIDLQYVWAREQSREKHQHYHCIAYLDGNKVQNGFAFLSIVENVWGTALGIDDPEGLVHFCDPGNGQYGIMIRRPSRFATEYDQQLQRDAFQAARAACIYWGSYLAKENQKMNTPRNVRSYGASIMR